MPGILLFFLSWTFAAEPAREDADAALKKGSTLHFDFFYDGAKRLDLREEAAPLAELLDGAYRKVGQEMRFIPKDRVQVVLYDSADFARDIKRDGWAGGMYDGKIRVPVGDFTEEKDRLERVLLHEYVHAAVHRMSPACPAWLNEGLAQLLEGADPAAAEKRLSAGKGKPVAAERLARSFGGLSAEEARWAYDRSLVLTRSLVEAHSLYRVKEFLEAVGSDPAAVEGEFARRFYREQADFVSEGYGESSR